MKQVLAVLLTKLRQEPVSLLKAACCTLLALVSLGTGLLLFQADLSFRQSQDSRIEDYYIPVLTDNIVATVTISPTVLTVTPSEPIPTVTESPSATPTVSSKPAVSTQPTVTTTITATPTITASPSPTTEPLSALVAFYADPQSDTDLEDANHQRVVDYILQRGANPVFNAGDIMEDGTEDSLDRFNAVTATLRSSRSFYSALGNNDRKIGDSSTPSSLYLNNFSYPNNERWYSVNWGNLHMVVLDSAFAAASQTQKDWLSADLQSAASQSRITGVMFHHPSYASSIQSYLIDHNVDFVIMGHEHAYRHYEAGGIHYFVLSGQPNIGYIKAAIYESKAEMTVYNHNNASIGSFTVNDR